MDRHRHKCRCRCRYRCRYRYIQEQERAPIDGWSAASVQCDGPLAGACRSRSQRAHVPVPWLQRNDWSRWLGCSPRVEHGEARIRIDVPPSPGQGLCLVPVLCTWATTSAYISAHGDSSRYRYRTWPQTWWIVASRLAICWCSVHQQNEAATCWRYWQARGFWGSSAR